MAHSASFCFFFFNDTATTEIYTLSLHDALPIFTELARVYGKMGGFAHLATLVKGLRASRPGALLLDGGEDRKSTRLNSSHTVISYAVFCLTKKQTCALPTLADVPESECRDRNST